MDNPVATTAATPPSNPLISGDPMFDSLPVSHRILLNPALLESVQKTAEILSQARGYVSNDLLGKTQTCFAVCVTAFETGLNPFFLAQGAFQTPEGKVGFDTRRIQAIVEAKNMFSKEPEAEYSGPWEKLVGKFEKVKSDSKGPNGKDKWYTRKTWGPADAKGCKLKVTYHFRDRNEPVEFEMDLAEVGTFFSTAWATEPKNQFYNLVFRRGLNQKRASALAGTPAYEDLLAEEAPMKDITPKGEKSGGAHLDEFAEEAKPAETVVETEPDSQSASVDNAKTEAKVKPAASNPVQDSKKASPDKPDPITIWASADETAREIKDVSKAVFVLRNLMSDAKTPAMAKTVFDQNMELISKLPKESANSLETELTKRFDKGDTVKCGPENGTLV